MINRNTVVKVVHNIGAAVAVVAIVLVSVSEFRGEEKNPIFYNKLGWEYLEREDYFRALVNFKKALKQNPHYKEALLGLGKAYLNTGAPGEALGLFENVLKLDRENTEAMLGRGFALTSLGRLNEAIKIFTKITRLREEEQEAHFGLARVYYSLGKRLWAKRKLERILRSNPFHYKSLLLMAELKSDEGRLSEAKRYVDKAVESNRELPGGYIQAGSILFKSSLRSGNYDYLEEAREEFKRALSIRPESLMANRFLGHIEIQLGNSEDAMRYLDGARVKYPGNPEILYSLGIANEKGGDMDRALGSFLAAGDALPSDGITRARIEDFLVLNGFKIGHPQRISRSKKHLEEAVRMLKRSMVDEAILHLRRSLYLNPMLTEPRELLRDLYRTRDYYRFYVDEIKSLAAMNPGGKYQDELSIAVIKRRDRFYHLEGYSTELPERDVPSVLVIDLWGGGNLTHHPDSGSLVSNYISFALSQMGRQNPVGIKKRVEISGKLSASTEFLGDNLEKLGDMVRNGEISSLDYIVYGTVREGSDSISADIRLMDFKTGVIINEFQLSENGRDAISRISLRAGRRLFSVIPYRGRILKLRDTDAVVNVGSYDGLKKGDRLVSYRRSSGTGGERTRKIVFTLKEVDTLLSLAEVLNPDDAEHININDAVYPLGKRQARMIK